MDQATAYLVNVVKGFLLIIAVLGLGYLSSRFIAGFNPLSYVLEIFGISYGWVIIGIVFAALVYAFLHVNSTQSYTLTFEGDELSYSGGTFMKETRAINVENIIDVRYEEEKPFKFGSMTLDLQGAKERELVVRYVTNVGERCDALKGFLGIGSVEARSEVRAEARKAVPKTEEKHEKIDFSKQVVGYIEDELHQGYGLQQIMRELLNQGYPTAVIEYAAQKVEEEHEVSSKDRKKELPKTDAHHLARRFHAPILGVTALMLILLSIFFIAGIDGDEDLPEKIDIFLYENLGINPDVYEISGSNQAYSRDELVQNTRATALLRELKPNPLMSSLRVSNAVDGFEKKATVFDISGEGIGKRTLVELRFKSSRAVDVLKVIESIPKTTATAQDILLTQGGIIAEKDPVLMFTFYNVEEENVLKAVYVIDKEIGELETFTFAAEERGVVRRASAKAVCGDGTCVAGESYRTCCQDCGCLPGFLCKNNDCVSAEERECNIDADCDDEDVMTQDECGGVPKDCVYTKITWCSSGDGACPEGCDSKTDKDCEEAAVAVEVVEEAAPEPDVVGVQESPRIIEVSITPAEVEIGADVLIEAAVTDANGKDDISRVWFEVLELAQTHGEAGDMNDAGSDGDKNSGDDIYSVKRTIGDHYITGWYHVTIFAQDRAGNKKKQQKMFKVFGEGGDVEQSIDCGNDFDCFIEAARECKDAKVTHSDSVELFGMLQTFTDHYEIRGIDNGQCVFYIRTESMDVTYTDELVQSMLDDGMTQEEIDQEEQDSKDMAEEMEGDDGVCRFETSDLVSMLENWNEGDISADDFDVAECEGAYFGG